MEPRKSTPDPFPWLGVLETQNEVIDRDHREAVAAGNRLLQLIEARDAWPELLATLRVARAQRQAFLDRGQHSRSNPVSGQRAASWHPSPHPGRVRPDPGGTGSGRDTAAAALGARPCTARPAWWIIACRTISS
jgi:hypothetical protein